MPLKICLVAKFPPIQGGVSMRSFRYAHALAERGHGVDVVTNAKEVRAPYRMFMRPGDWDRCAADYGAGYVRVHWTDPVDRSQHHIPMSSPFVSKLVSLGIAAFEADPFDVVFSYYLEPYAVAGHMIAQITGRPHVVKTAGSDAGRLWPHGQFKPFYDHILRDAEMVIAGGQVAADMEAAGVDGARIRGDRDFTIPDAVFAPDGPALDLEAHCGEAAASPQYADLLWGHMESGRRCIGIYGKLGRSKGTDALLEAIARLNAAGRDVGLLVMGHDRPRDGHPFRRTAAGLGVQAHVRQIPFLPHWRVPEFIRRCLAVCCLEQDFPISIHAPITPREVLACGTCLVGSAELIGKLPFAERMVDGYNCVAVADAHRPAPLAEKLAAIVDDPDRAAIVGRRGRAYVIEMQRVQRFPDRLERALTDAASATGTGPARSATDTRNQETAAGLRLTRLAIDAMSDSQRADCVATAAGEVGGLDWARGIHHRLRCRVDGGDSPLAPMADAIRLDLRMAEMMAAEDTADRPAPDNAQLFRLSIDRWALGNEGIRDLVPSPDGTFCVERFDYDANAFLEARMSGRFPDQPPPTPSVVILLRNRRLPGLRTLVVDPTTTEILDLCDGSLSVAQIADRMNGRSGGDGGGDPAVAVDRIQRLFELGVIRLTQPVPSI